MSAKILVVEDEEKLARFVELELKHEGYDVKTEGSGRAALAEALAGSYDLILLDIMLPELNGLEVLRRLNKEKPRRVPPKKRLRKRGSCPGGLSFSTSPGTE